MAATDKAGQLPGRLEGPLHFPSPPSCVWTLIWFLLIAGLLFWLGRLLWRRLRRMWASRPAAPVSAPLGKRGSGGIAAAIATIRQRNLESKRYRQGCHELSGALRLHWEERGLVGRAGPRLTRMTAREIRGHVGERPATSFLSRLSQLQFGRRKPTRKEFKDVCKLAAEVVEKRGGG
jgi:hypothetical protein